MGGSGLDEIRMSVLFITYTYMPPEFKITVREALDDFCEQLSQKFGDYFVTNEEEKSIVFFGPRSVFQEITDRAEETV